MKKLSLIIISLLTATTVILSGCGKDTSGNEKNGNGAGNSNNNSSGVQYYDNLESISELLPAPTLENYGDMMSFTEATARLDELQEKTDNDKEMLLEVGGIPVSATAVRYANIACNEYYAQAGDADSELVQSEINAFYKLNAAVEILSNVYHIGITDSDMESISSTITQFKEAYGEEYDSIFEAYTYQTPYYYFYSQLYNMAYTNLHDYFYGENGNEEFVNALYEKVVAQLKEDNKIRAKHILISFPDDIEKDADGNIPESAKAQTLASANEVLEKVNAGEDFDSLIKQYGTDPGAEAYPDGYIFGKGEMVEPFEKAAYELEIGEVSGLVETTYGYHIIKKLDVEDKAAVIASEAYSEESYNEFSQILSEIADEIEIEKYDNYQSRVDTFLTEFQQQKAEAEAEAEALQNSEAKG